MALNTVPGDDFANPGIYFSFGNFGDLGNFIPIVVQEGNVEEFLQALQAVGPDICFGSFRVQQPVSFFPDPDGMCFNATEVL